MSFQKYKFKKYNKNYPKLFAIEKRKLKKILPKNAKIEHIGSTSIPGLGGKGIIDLAISVKKSQMPSCIKKLEKSKYKYYKSKEPTKLRKYFEKAIKYNKKERRIHLHLIYNENIVWQSFIAVRNYLKQNPQAVKKYAEIKKQASEKAKKDKKKYHKHKKDFIEEISKKGMKQK
jgi:GrpB-like predicted nucleotidyltransferase (UPF0157 family)